MKSKACQYKDFFFVVAEIRFLICPMLTMGERIDVLEPGGTFDL